MFIWSVDGVEPGRVGRNVRMILMITVLWLIGLGFYISGTASFVKVKF